MSNQYRKDIDGLRAVAVIPVVLFHSGYSMFSGGYVGVDIFFVISGYLITNILIKQLQNDQFSIATFYERRIKRIFPALFTVLIVSSLAAIWLMLPGEIKQFKQSVISTLFFYSNYFFMFDVGYFADPAETKPLLHMWSLAVEEQFYVVFPVYLFLAFKYCRKYVGIITIFLLLISFAYSAVLVNYLPGDAFYSTPARAWELMIGSLLAIYPKREVLNSPLKSNILSITGLGLIVASVVFFEKTTPFPGYMAAIPVLGSALILYAAHSERNLVGQLLSTPLFRFIGLISYSLYLWHWPVLTFARLYSLGSHPYELMPWLLLLMILLAFLSWKFIETPFRRGKLFNNQSTIKFNQFSGALLVAGICLLIFAFSDYKRGIPAKYRTHMEKRVDTKPLKLEDCDEFKASQRSIWVCYLGALKAQTTSFALLGDSHTTAMMPGVYQAAEKYGKKGIFAGSGGCIALFGVNREKQGFEHCRSRMDAFQEYLKVHPEIEQIIIASRWGTYTTGKRYKDTLGDDFYISDDLTTSLSFEENQRVFERGMKRTVEFLKGLDKKVIFVSQVPEAEFGGWDVVRANRLGKKVEFRPILKEYFERQRIAHSEFEKYQAKGDVEVIYLHEFMCGEEFCDYFSEGKSIYIDNNHISRTYAYKLSPVFEQLFKD